MSLRDRRAGARDGVPVPDVCLTGIGPFDSVPALTHVLSPTRLRDSAERSLFRHRRIEIEDGIGDEDQGGLVGRFAEGLGLGGMGLVFGARVAEEGEQGLEVGWLGGVAGDECQGPGDLVRRGGSASTVTWFPGASTPHTGTSDSLCRLCNV